MRTYPHSIVLLQLQELLAFLLLLPFHATEFLRSVHTAGCRWWIMRLSKRSGLLSYESISYQFIHTNNKVNLHSACL
jgi:hypothetical protein